MPAYRHALAQTTATYGSGPATRHVKLSITLPEDLLEEVKAAAAESNTGVSAVIAAAVRRALAEAEQAQLDRALELDAEDNAAWANDALAMTARAWADLQW